MNQRRAHSLLIHGAAALTASVLVALCIGWVGPARLWNSATSGSRDDAASVMDPGKHRSVKPSDATVSLASTRNTPLPGLDASLSATPEPLYLVSTSPGHNAKHGTARLGTSDKNPQTYVAGAVLLNGARLAEIHSQYVVLERDGKRSKLYSASNDMQSALAMVGGVPVPKAPNSTYSDVLTQYLRSSPLFDGDQIKGYQVYPGPRNAVFAQMGLQSGDVLLAIDGRPLFDSRDAVESLQHLTYGIAMTVTLERAGKVELVNVDGSLIVQDQQREQFQNIDTPPRSQDER